jgi:hypothetical protein
MDNNVVTKQILKLANKATLWTSTIEIPIGDNESLLDISSAARGELSVTPDAATKQPTKFPTGKIDSFYMFDPDVYGENYWESLKAMPPKWDVFVDAVLFTTLPTRTAYWKATYYLCCSHGMVINEKNGTVYDGDNVGPGNVKTEYLKCVKTAGHSFKGNKIYESVYYRFVTSKLYPVVSSKLYIFSSYTINSYI